MACLAAEIAYPDDGSAKRAAASDGGEYVYVNLNSDTQSYLIAPKDDSKLKITPSDGTAEDDAKKNADMSSYRVVSKGGDRDRLSYYQSMREKILAKLKRNYTSHYNDGDVHMFFILNKEGSIVRIDVAISRSTKDAGLINTALISLQQAGPFGPFPKDLSVKQVLFSLTVSFKKDSR